MFQQVRTSFLIGLTDKQPKLRYHIETRARDASGFTEVVDRVPATGSIEYDLTKTAVLPINAGRGTPNLFTRPLFLDTTGSIIQTQVNPAILASRGKQDILLLHLHNLPEDQAELVTLYPTH
jgi:hypothetical protein